MISENVIDLIVSSTVGALTGAVIGATMIDISDPIVVGVGTIAFGGLTGAIKVLWDRNTAQEKTTELALIECKSEHKKSAEQVNTLVEKVIELSAAVGTLKGRIEGFQEATHKSDLDTHEAKNHG